MSKSVITIVATVDADSIDEADAAEYVAKALQRAGAVLVDCEWTPHQGLIALGCGVDHPDRVTVVDLNNEKEARAPIDAAAPVAGELEPMPMLSNSAVALDGAVRLVAASIKPRGVEHVVTDALSIGQAAGITTEIADQFIEWMDRHES